MRRIVLASSAALLVSSGTDGLARCLPPGIYPSEAPSVKGGVSLYLDASLSMAGYVAGVGAPAMSDLLTISEQHAQRLGVRFRTSSFAADIASFPPANLNEWSTPRPYVGQTSRIDTVLKRIAADRSSSLSLLVSDLWLDSDSFSGSAEVGLGGPLRTILQQGRSVAVLGMMAPFKGRLFTRRGSFSGAKERPLYVVVVGSTEQVAAYVDSVRASGSPTIAAMKATVFPAQSYPWRVAEVRPFRGGVSKIAAPTFAQGLPSYKFSRRVTTATSGGLESMSSIRGVLPEAATWSGPPLATTQVWKLSGDKVCNSTSWTPMSPLKGAWSSKGPGTAQFSITPKTAPGLLGGTYIVAAKLGTKGLVQPNPASAWMREWNVASDDAQIADLVKRSVSRFPTPGIAGLATILEAAASRSRVNYAFAVVVDVVE